MVFFNDCKTLEEAKKLYKKLAFENHPDRGGDNEKMQQINNEYSFFVAKFAKGTSEEINEEFNVAQKFVDVLNKLAGLEGIIVELAGDWLWISGNTYPYKDKLKEIGCRFALPLKRRFGITGRKRTKPETQSLTAWRKLGIFTKQSR